VKITGSNWIELPAGSYKRRTNTTNTQLEVDVPFDMIISHAPDDEWSKIPPLRILSFDIECAGRKGIFPDPKIDQVIQIATMVTLQGIVSVIRATTQTLTLNRRIKTIHQVGFYIGHLRTYSGCASDEF